MRLRCELFGCRCSVVPDCDVCGEHLYDDEFIQEGRISPLVRWVRETFRRAVGLVVGLKCVVCKRRYRRGWDDYCCSEKCFNEWLPF